MNPCRRRRTGHTGRGGGAVGERGKHGGVGAGRVHKIQLPGAKGNPKRQILMNRRVIRSPAGGDLPDITDSTPWGGGGGV